jgi:hypothetical protein
LGFANQFASLKLCEPPQNIQRLVSTIDHSAASESLGGLNPESL